MKSARVERARHARKESESRLAWVNEHIVQPLHEMRQENHITDDVSRAIERRVEGER